MEYEKLCCEECIVYRIHYELDNIDKCYQCGNMTARWKQNESGTMYIECSECGSIAAVDMNTPCELEYESMFKCHLLPMKLSQEKLLVISKFIGMTVLQTAKSMKNEGLFLEDDFYGMCSKLIFMDKQDISYTVEPYDPRFKYIYIKKCGYPYRAIREEW